MKHIIRLFSLVLLAGCTAAPQLSPSTIAGAAAAAPSAYVWMQLRDGGTSELRAVVEKPDASCPVFQTARGPVTLTPRANAGSGFALICAAKLPHGTGAVAGIAPPPNAPQRILVLGDTGCRVKDGVVQDCTGPRSWPFPALALAAANLKPDLVVHLGDYVSRESACPPGNAVCVGAPHGDNWEAWKADFFAPAAPLLATAPWIFVRGNHEDCTRNGAGFQRLLGQGEGKEDCIPHTAPYRIPFTDLEMLVMDDANASDTDVDPALTPAYQSDLAQTAKPRPMPVWMLLHRPIWAAIAAPLNIPIGGNAQLIAAAETNMVQAPVQLMLSGHIHSFQALNYTRRNGVAPPPQIVGGNGGDALHAVPANLKGAVFQGHSGVGVQDGVSVGGFGFLLLTRAGPDWLIDLYNVDGLAQGQCRLVKTRVECPKLPRARP